MQLNGISSDRSQFQHVISRTRMKSCTILSSLHKKFEVFEEMQLLHVCTKQGIYIKKILFLLSNSTWCGSCVRKIARYQVTREETRKVLFVANSLPTCCCILHAHQFEFANTSWPTLVFPCEGRFNAK